MSGKLSHKFFVLIFIVIGAIFRLYALDTVPPAPSLDEASIGWNAYSILKTGRDEYGTFLPWVLRAYDDWRPGLYIYTVIPFLFIFGLEPIAIRLPSVLFSIISIIGVYGIGRELFRKRTDDIPLFSMIIDVPLVTTALFAFSPWHIYLSRLGHEVNLGFFLVVFGILFFLRALRFTGIWWFTLSCLFFGLSLHAYQSQKIVVPLLLIGLIIIYRKEMKNHIKNYFVGAIIFMLSFVTMVFITISPEGLSRVKGTSIFYETSENQQVIIKKYLIAKETNDIVDQILYHPKIQKMSLVVSQYMAHFDPKWLYIGSQRENHKVPYIGLLYVWEGLLILVGLLFIHKLSNLKTLAVLLLIICVSVIPAAVTTQAPHAMRAYTMIIGMLFLASTGLVFLLQNTNQKPYIFLLFILVLFLYTFGIQKFSRNYFNLFPELQSDSFQYAGQLALSKIFLSDKHNQYDEFIVSNEGELYQSYMFYLFTTKYDPNKYISSGGTHSGGFAQSHKIENITFRSIAWDKDIFLKSKTLIIANISDITETLLTKYTFEDKNGVIKVIAVEL